MAKTWIQPKRRGEKLDVHRMSKKDKVTAESLKKQEGTK